MARGCGQRVSPYPRRVPIQVDTRELEAAVLRAASAAAALRAVAGDTARLPTTVHDPQVATGLAVLADAVADVCDVVALDLDLIGRQLRSGALDYARTEAAILPGQARG
jgi:hypothetical protein